MGQVIAVFDLEGTLTQSGRVLWKEILKWNIWRNYKFIRVISHITTQICIMFLHNTGLISAERLRLSIMRGMAGFLKGVNEEDLPKLAKISSAKLIKQLRSDIEKILQDHKRQGHILVLISTFLEPVIEMMGRRLDINLAIGTGLEKKAGYYTGQLSGGLCSDERRASMLRERLTEAGLQVDLGGSYAYGDRIWDKPVLEMVGNPVAVYPDGELRAYAQKKGWKIIG